MAMLPLCERQSSDRSIPGEILVRSVRLLDPSPEVIPVGRVNTRPEVMIPIALALLISVIVNKASLPLFLILATCALTLYRDLVHPQWNLLFFVQGLAADLDRWVADLQQGRPSAIAMAIALVGCWIIAPTAVGGFLGTLSFWLLAYHLTFLNILTAGPGLDRDDAPAAWQEWLRRKLGRPDAVWLLGLGAIWISLYGLVQVLGADPDSNNRLIARVRSGGYSVALLISAIGTSLVAFFAFLWARPLPPNDPASRLDRVGLLLAGATLWIAMAVVALVLFLKLEIGFPFDRPAWNALGAALILGGSLLVLRLRRLGSRRLIVSGLSLGATAVAGALLLPLLGWLLWRVVTGWTERGQWVSLGLFSMVLLVWLAFSKFWLRVSASGIDDERGIWIRTVIGATGLLLLLVLTFLFGGTGNLMIAGVLIGWGWVRVVSSDLTERS